MTPDAVRGALRSAIQQAVRLGVEAGKRAGTAQGQRMIAGGQVAAEAQAYAEAMVMSAVEAYAEQAVEDVLKDACLPWMLKSLHPMPTVGTPLWSVWWAGAAHVMNELEDALGVKLAPDDAMLGDTPVELLAISVRELLILRDVWVLPPRVGA